MKNNRLKALVAVVLVLFFAASLVQADALDDLIASYSFDYDSGEIDVGNVSDSLAGDVFSFDVDVISADSGDYVFYVDVEDVGGIVSGSSVVNLDSVGEIVRVNVSSYLLSGVSEFNYSLRVYDSGDFLVYEKSGFVSKVYSDYDSGIEILEINDYAFGDDYILFNVSFNSSVAVLENVTMFLEYDDEVISLIGEVSFGVGVNYVVFGIDSDTILYTHHNGTYNVSRILVGEKLFVVDYTTGSYNYVDFVEGSFLYGVDNYYVDSDNDSLIDYLEIEFQIEVREAGDYAVGAYVDSLDGVHITNISEEKYLEVGKQVIVARVNGSLIYSLGVNGPYGLSLAVLGKEEMWIDFMMDVYFDEEYSYLDFERPPLSDLEVVIIGRNVSVKNIGEADAFGIGVKVLNDSNERVFVIDELDVGEEYLFVVGFDENLTVIVDYDNFIDEENESNNVGFAVACVENLVNDSWSAWVDDGVCGVDDFQLQNRTVVEYDSNFCGEVSNVTYFEYQNVSCDFCTPNLINDSWSEWVDEGVCGVDDIVLQSRFLVEYDSNFCGEVSNVTHYEYREVGPSFVNSSWLGWVDEGSCGDDDLILQVRNLTSGDSYGCADDLVYFEYQNVSCDFCVPVETFYNWSDWVNVSGCVDDLTLQNRNRTSYDLNGCFGLTGLVSDVFVSSFEEVYQNVSCDSCTPNLVDGDWSEWVDEGCSVDNMNQSRFYVEYDSNFCGEVLNVTHYEYRGVGPSFVNSSWLGWVDEGSCGDDDLILQVRNLTSGDSYGCADDLVYFEYRNLSCDFCSPNLINDSWSEWMNETACFANNTILQSRNRTGYDSNFCGEVLNVTYFEYNVTECGVVIDDVVPQFDSSSVVYDNVSLVSEFGVDVVGSNGSVYLNVDGVNYSAVGSGESYFVELNLSGGDYSCYWFAFGNGNDNLYGESGMFNYSVGVVEDEDDLDVNLISPVDGYVKRTSGSSYDVDFNFNVSGDFEISYCELIVGGEVRGRIDDVGRDALLEFVNIEVDRGSYDWKVRCVDVGEVEGISEVRGLKIARRSSSSSSSSSGRAYSDEPVLTEKVIPEEENVIYLGSGSGNGGNAMLGYGSFGDGSIVLNPVEEEVLFVRLVEWFFGFFR